MKRALLTLTLAVALAAAPRAMAQEFVRIIAVEERVGLTALALTPDGLSLAFAAKDNQLLWRPVDGTRRLLVGEHPAAVVSLAYAADGKTLAALTRDRMVLVWTVGTEQPTAKYKVDVAAGLVGVGADGKVVLVHVVGGQDKAKDVNFAEVRLRDVASGKERVVARTTTPIALPGIGANFSLLALAADGSTVAVGNVHAGGTEGWSLLQTATGKSVNVPAAAAGESVLALSRDGRTLVTGKGDAVRTWDLPSGTVLGTIKATASLCTVAADGRMLVTFDGKNHVTTYNRPAEPAQGAVAKKAANPDRIRGMKASVADIEKGRLVLKSVPPPESAWHQSYLQLVKKQCGVDTIYVNTNDMTDQHFDEMHGYNAVMLLEIEHRFGQGILGRLAKQAEQDYFKGIKGK